MPSPVTPEGDRAAPVPAPPGGHALHIDRVAVSRLAPVTRPVVEEVSAGGLTIREFDGVPHAAVISRRNRGGRLEWCLPKGHLEGDESPQEAAVREIFEETGIRSRILAPLCTIDYWFTGDDRRVHKVVHHFLLEGYDGELTVTGDPDHEAEAAAWMSLDEVMTQLAYPNERRLAELARTELNGTA